MEERRERYKERKQTNRRKHIHNETKVNKKNIKAGKMRKEEKENKRGYCLLHKIYD
jgi:hypothetical protein